MNQKPPFFLTLALLLGCQSQANGLARGQELYATCAQCHQADGSGNADALAPSIAGLDAWYVENQLTKYREGARGTHPADVGGLKMRPMARHLRTQKDIAAVAQYIEGMPKKPAAATVGDGDAANGARLFATCVACHGAEGTGNQTLSAPNLTITDDWYLVTQLTHFKAGVRGAAPKDTTGAQMRPMAATLPDEQAIKDVVAHIQTLR